MKTLFDFQQKTVEGVQNLCDSGKKTVLLISLMGTGKTVMASWLVNQMVQQGKRCLLLVDLNCLIDQIASELWEWKIPYTILQSDRLFDPTLPVIVASAQTLEKRIERGAELREYLGNIDFIVIDEAHNLSYRKSTITLRNYYLDRGSTILGMTATPYRLSSQEYLGQWYEDVVVSLQPPELIKMGRAVPCRIFGFEDYFNLDEIATGADGDFLDTDMEAQSISKAQLHKVYDEWQTLTPDHQTIAFCSTVNHAIALSNYFTEQGVKSAYISGDTPPTERKKLFNKLESKDLTVLCSVNTITAGFNCECVSCILYVRLTRSKAMYHQGVGRAARMYSGKDFYYILDFGSNYKSLGSPMSYQDYDISQKAKFFREKTKVCPQCGARVSIFARFCTECGFEFKKSAEEEISSEYTESELDLDVHMVEYFCREDKQKLARFRYLKKETYHKGDRPESASNQFKEEFGFFPPMDWHLFAVLGRSPSVEQISVFEEYLKKFAPHEFWLKIQMKAEFGEKIPGSKRSKGKKQENKQFRFTFPPKVRWWEVLACSPNASPDEVKIAYRKIALQWHPDICRDVIAEGKMKEINYAYDEYQRVHRVA